MNHAPSNQSGVNSTFSSHTGPQTNPFTADLKGEFTSNFGTNTNAFSQMFKEGGFAGSNNTRMIIIGVAGLLVVGAIAYFVMSGSETSEDESFDDGKEVADTNVGDEAGLPANEAKTEENAATNATSAASNEAAPTEANTAATSAPVATASSGAVGAVSLSSPSDGATMEYDETAGPASFSWSGEGGTIVFSRSRSMKPENFHARVSGSNYNFNHPYPGTWYWRVENASGSSEIRSFTVSPPVRRNIVLSQPAAGGTLLGSGGSITWQGDRGVAFYRVEFTNGSWATPNYRYSTAGNAIQLQGVSPGTYQMRLGGFSEVAGRWEFGQPISVTVQ